MKMNFSKDELAMVYQYAAGTKEDTLAGLKEIVPVIRDRQTRGIVEFPIVKDTTPNMMNPRLYTTSYNKPQGQQFDDTAVLSFIKLQYT